MIWKFIQEEWAVLPPRVRTVASAIITAMGIVIGRSLLDYTDGADIEFRAVVNAAILAGLGALGTAILSRLGAGDQNLTTDEIKVLSRLDT